MVKYVSNLSKSSSPFIPGTVKSAGNSDAKINCPCSSDRTFPNHDAFDDRGILVDLCPILDDDGFDVLAVQRHGLLMGNPIPWMIVGHCDKYMKSNPYMFTNIHTLAHHNRRLVADRATRLDLPHRIACIGRPRKSRHTGNFHVIAETDAIARLCKSGTPPSTSRLLRTHLRRDVN